MHIRACTMCVGDGQTDHMAEFSPAYSHEEDPCSIAVRTSTGLLRLLLALVGFGICYDHGPHADRITVQLAPLTRKEAGRKVAVEEDRMRPTFISAPLLSSASQPWVTVPVKVPALYVRVCGHSAGKR